MRLSCFSLSLALFFAVNSSFAQKGSIDGYLKDMDTKNPIYGATINIAADNKGDNTDAFG